MSKARRSIEVDIKLAGIEGIGEDEGAHHMRHGRTFRKKENTFSGHAPSLRKGWLEPQFRAIIIVDSPLASCEGNSTTTYPMNAAVKAIARLVNLNMSVAAHTKPLSRPLPECTNPPIGRFA